MIRIQIIFNGNDEKFPVRQSLYLVSVDPWRYFCLYAYLSRSIFFPFSLSTQTELTFHLVCTSFFAVVCHVLFAFFPYQQYILKLFWLHGQQLADRVWGVRCGQKRLFLICRFTEKDFKSTVDCIAFSYLRGMYFINIVFTCFWLGTCMWGRGESGRKVGLEGGKHFEQLLGIKCRGRQDGTIVTTPSWFQPCSPAIIFWRECHSTYS